MNAALLHSEMKVTDVAFSPSQNMIENGLYFPKKIASVFMGVVSHFRLICKDLPKNVGVFLREAKNFFDIYVQSKVALYDTESGMSTIGVLALFSIAVLGIHFRHFLKFMTCRLC